MIDFPHNSIDTAGRCDDKLCQALYTQFFHLKIQFDKAIYGEGNEEKEYSHNQRKARTIKDS